MIDPQILYRLAKRLRRIGIPFLPGILNRLNLVLTGCDLPDEVKVGVGVRFQHYRRPAFICGPNIHHNIFQGRIVLTNYRLHAFLAKSCSIGRYRDDANSHYNSNAS